MTTKTYDPIASVPYDDDLRSGYVIGYYRQTKAGSRSWSWWYGPDHGWSTTFGGLDGSVRVWDSKVKAAAALKRYGGSSRDLKIQTVEQARAVTADSLERYALSLLARVSRLRNGDDALEEILRSRSAS